MEKIQFKSAPKLWWISQPEAHSFYLLLSEYQKIQDWFVEHMGEEAIIQGIDQVGKSHPSHAICRLFSETDIVLGDLSHPIFTAFPYLKDIRQKLNEFTHE